mgnify:CR=1 FL=1|jgi:hypothetical protein
MTRASETDYISLSQDRQRQTFPQNEVIIMVTIKDFMEKNENVLIIIETSETRNTTEPLRRELWKGMLYDIPKDLQNREVIQEGYGIVAQCNILTILENGDTNIT